MKMLVSFFRWILMLTACSKYGSDESEIRQKGRSQRKEDIEIFQTQPMIHEECL